MPPRRPRKSRAVKPNERKYPLRETQPINPSSKKFTSRPMLTIQDVMKQTRALAQSDCLIFDMRYKPIRGRLKNYTLYFTFPATGFRKMREIRAIQFILEQQRGAPLVRGEQLQQLCKTSGCLNSQHYRINSINPRTQEIQMFTRMQVRSLYETAQEKGEIILPMQDEHEAKRMRLAIYNTKRLITKQDPSFQEAIQDIEIVLHKDGLLIRKKGKDMEARLAAAGVPAISKEAQTDQMMHEEMERIKEAYEQQPSKKDPAADVLRQLGYAPKRYLNVPTERGEKLPPSSVPTEQGEPSPAEVPTYDTAYAKAAAGRPLTSEEEALLAEGPPPEPTPPDAA